MKRKKLNSKLMLNKEKISNLNEIKGGDYRVIESIINCPPTWTLQIITNGFGCGISVNTVCLELSVDTPCP